MELSQVINYADREFRVIYNKGEYFLAREFCSDISTNTMVLFQKQEDRYKPVTDQKVVTSVIKGLLDGAKKASLYLNKNKK